MKKITYSIIALLACLISCTGKKKQYSFSNAWLYNSYQDAKQELENISQYGGDMENGMDGACFIDLQADSSFTSYLSTFSFGRWQFRDSMLILKDHNNRELNLSVKKLTNEELICRNTYTGKLYRFNGSGNRFSSQSENPFSIENNQWRIPARKRENEAQIGSRLKNHFRYWEKYFNWAVKNNMNYLEVSSTPSVLEMYSNGFKVQYYNNQSPEWKRNFFDSTDSWKAYEKIYYLVAQKKIKWPETENKFERFVSAFQQMQGWLEEK